MFALEDEEDNYLAELIESMLIAGKILIEQDCNDLRPLLTSIINNPNFTDCGASIATFIAVYVAREVNNWRVFVTETSIEEFLIGDEIENALYHIFALTDKLGKRSIDNVGEELYAFVAEQYIATYEP